METGQSGTVTPRSHHLKPEHGHGMVSLNPIKSKLTVMGCRGGVGVRYGSVGKGPVAQAWGLGSIPGTSIKARSGHIDLQSHCWGVRDRGIAGAQWLAAWPTWGEGEFIKQSQNRTLF